MSNVTIFHNPRCGTSRTVLAALRERGIEPAVVHYLETPPSRSELQALVLQLGVGARAVLREKEALAGELGLLDPARSDEELLDAMAAHPVLINRPIVVTPQGARLCRPATELDALVPPTP